MYGYEIRYIMALVSFYGISIFFHSELVYVMEEGGAQDPHVDGNRKLIIGSQIMLMTKRV